MQTEYVKIDIIFHNLAGCQRQNYIRYGMDHVLIFNIKAQSLRVLIN